MTCLGFDVSGVVNGTMHPSFEGCGQLARPFCPEIIFDLVPSQPQTHQTPDMSNPRHIKPKTHQTSDNEYRAANYTADKNSLFIFQVKIRFIFKFSNRISIEI